MAKQGRFQRKRSFKKKRQYKAKAPLCKMEKKGMDTIVGDIARIIPDVTTTAPLMYVLNLVQEGTGSYNRIGRKIALDSIRIRIRWVCNIATNDASTILPENLLRFVIVWDRQPDGVNPTWDDVFQDIQGNGTTVFGIMTQPRYSSMSRFTILRDHFATAKVQAVGTATVDTTSVTGMWEDYIKLGKRECTYKGTTNPMLLPSINSGALYLMTGAASAAVNNQAIMSPSSSIRLRYYD